MKFTETTLSGSFVVELEKHSDERGYFARSWCRQEFESHGLETKLVQCNVSYNRVAGTLRGLHYQAYPHAEVKLVRCTRGGLYDVIVDLRTTSPTFLRWFGLRLTPDDGKMLYIPHGFAHGFQTLEAETEVFYQMSEFYVPGAGRGIRWNDPTLAIEWPLPVACISEKDKEYPDCTLERIEREIVTA